MDEVLDLFIELGASIEQLDFPVIYASGLSGTSSLDPDVSTQKPTMDPILDAVIEHIPEPDVDPEGSLQFQPALLDYNDFVGRIGVGLIKRGTLKLNSMASCVRLDGSIKQFRVQKIFGYLGLQKLEISEAHAGDIVAIAGLPDIFGVNTSPFNGREGKFLTARKIEERLMKETEKDVSLKFEQVDSESWMVSGRGELHLSILIENMRREGYELQVSKPQIITKEIDGKLCEPFEDVQIDVPEEYVGNVIELLGARGGTMENMENRERQVRLNYTIPSRGLIGFMTEFMTLTKGYGMINHTFKEYLPMVSTAVGQRKNGVLVSMENGKATAYSLGALEDRGIMFIGPGTEVYEGMIVGENNHDNDLAVNVVKGKNLTNTRSAGKDNTVVLKRPREMSLEVCLDYINEDELVEVTPLNYRLRKKILNANDRKKYDNKKN